MIIIIFHHRCHHRRLSSFVFRYHRKLSSSSSHQVIIHLVVCQQRGSKPPPPHQNFCYLSHRGIPHARKSYNTTAELLSCHIALVVWQHLEAHSNCHYQIELLLATCPTTAFPMRGRATIPIPRQNCYHVISLVVWQQRTTIATTRTQNCCCHIFA